MLLVHTTIHQLRLHAVENIMFPGCRANICMINVGDHQNVIFI